jgi:hypothetical protein
MDALRFPALSGRALDGTPFSAPRDLAGARTVVLAAFVLEHRSAKLARGSVVAAMKAAIGAPELRAATIPLFVDDIAAFARSLGIGDRTHLSVLLVEPDGRIAWRGSGPYSAAAGTSLSAALAAR